MRKFLYLTLLLSFYSYSQTIQTEVSASELVYTSILKIESGILTGKGYEIHLPNLMANLSGIKPKKYDLNYFGLTYSPTIEEIKVWKEWFEKNKAKITYGEVDKVSGEKVILFEYEKGKFRSDLER